MCNKIDWHFLKKKPFFDIYQSEYRRLDHPEKGILFCLSNNRFLKNHLSQFFAECNKILKKHKLNLEEWLN